MPRRVQTITRPARRRTAPLLSAVAGLGLALPASLAAHPPAHPSVVAGGNAHSCALERGRAYCWGENDFGQLGNGSTANSLVPVAVDTGGALAGKTITQISAGGGAGLDTCALDSTGTPYCWGSGADGALGDGSTADSSVPVPVDTGGVLAGKKIVQLSVGADGGCVLDSAGGAYCWGDNDFGELGDGGTSYSSVAVPVDTRGVLAGQFITQISAGFQDTCALTRAGRAYCWGDDAFGELGDNGAASAGYSPEPVAVDFGGAPAGQTLTQISAGWLDACALDKAGAAYCWGMGPITSSLVPAPVAAGGVPAGQTLTQISAGLGEVCSLDSTGAAFCWGDNDQGELGDRSTVSSAAPVPVYTGGLLARRTLTQISAGGFHACATDTTGAQFCWGDNNQGDLGNGRAAQSDVPVFAGPRAPTAVTAVPRDGAAAVSWRAPASLDGGTLLGYTATATPGGASCQTSGSTSCVLAGLANGTHYRVTVVAHATSGDSGTSAPATVTPRG
jgi:alpha-tubulin suppressor-like RCC1 family protein